MKIYKIPKGTLVIDSDNFNKTLYFNWIVTDIDWYVHESNIVMMNGSHAIMADITKYGTDDLLFSVKAGEYIEIYYQSYDYL